MAEVKELSQSSTDAKSVQATAFTTLTFGQEWKCSGTLYVRKVGEKERYLPDVAKALRAKIPHIEEKQKSEWLLGVSKFGENPILLTYKVSQNTLEQSRLFSCVLAKETLHHTDVEADMTRVFNDPLDTNLRKGWMEKKDHCPIFIKLWDAYPAVYENLKGRHGEKISLRYQRGQLHIIVPGDMFTLEVQTIKD